MTMYEVGEWATASIGLGSGSDLQIIKELPWPDSLGQLYSAFTGDASHAARHGLGTLGAGRV